MPPPRSRYPQWDRRRSAGFISAQGSALNWLQNEHLINRVGTAAPGSISSHVGMVGVASIGYALPMGLRFELEGDLRNNPISGAHDLGFAATAGGRERKYGPMVNVLYDLSPWIPPGYFSPYAGVGVGYQWTRLSGFHVNGSPTGFPSITTGGTKGAIAYQFILGGAMPIPQVRGLALTAEYRFFGVGSRSYDVAVTPVAGGAPVPSNLKLGNDFNHSVLIGLRYNFLPPPPPPPAPAAVPAQAPARSYLGVLRLGQGDAHRSRSADHRRSGSQLDQGAVHADRGERLYRHLGHAALQSGPVDPPRPGSAGGTGQGWRAAERDHHPRLRRH